MQTCWLQWQRILEAGGRRLADTAEGPRLCVWTVCARCAVRLQCAGEHASQLRGRDLAHLIVE